MATKSNIKNNINKYRKASEKSSMKVSRRVETSNPFKKGAKMLFKAFILTFFGLIVLFPFYYMVSMALMSFDEMNGAGQIPLVPDVPIFSNFKNAFKNGFFEAFLFSSSVLAINIVLKLTVCSLLGYAFGNYNFTGKNFIWWVLMLTLTVPEVALLSGQFNVATQLSWDNGPMILIGLSAPFIASIFTGYMFRIAFETIPDSVKDAALIDGVTGPGYFFKIALPMVSSTIWTVVILTTFASWNSYMWPSILLVDSEAKTIPLWLFQVGRDMDGTGLIHNEWQMAGAVLATLPTVIFYLVFKNKINNVVAGGANKG